MSDRLTYWKCPHCHGTGRVFEAYMREPLDCLECDGTGNSCTDGKTERHKRRLAEFDRERQP